MQVVLATGLGNSAQVAVFFFLLLPVPSLPFRSDVASLQAYES